MVPIMSRGTGSQWIRFSGIVRITVLLPLLAAAGFARRYRVRSSLTHLGFWPFCWSLAKRLSSPRGRLRIASGFGCPSRHRRGARAISRFGFGSAARPCIGAQMGSRFVGLTGSGLGHFLGAAGSSCSQIEPSCVATVPLSIPLRPRPRCPLYL
jgi:hypothetical protein